MADVSVVIVARDAERYIGEALASVAAQTVSPRDVLVVDHASTDATAQIAHAHGARVVRHATGNIASARNVGISHARGAAIAFLDADDRWLPRKLELQLAQLAARPELGFVGCLLRLFCQDADKPGWWKPAWNDPQASEPALLSSAVVIRRTAFDVVGLYDESIGVSTEDVEWTARAQDHGIPRAVVGEVLLERRVHASSVSLDHELAMSRILGVLRSSIARKRVIDG
jgi:glycosyltransferase involved in cell wall biosynthesis